MPINRTRPLLVSTVSPSIHSRTVASSEFTAKREQLILTVGPAVWIRAEPCSGGTLGLLDVGAKHGRRSPLQLLRDLVVLLERRLVDPASAEDGLLDLVRGRPKCLRDLLAAESGALILVGWVLEVVGVRVLEVELLQLVSQLARSAASSSWSASSPLESVSTAPTLGPRTANRWSPSTMPQGHSQASTRQARRSVPTTRRPRRGAGWRIAVSTMAASTKVCRRFFSLGWAVRPLWSPWVSSPLAARQDRLREHWTADPLTMPVTPNTTGFAHSPRRTV